MLELQNNTLVFSFPEVHPEAKLTIEFQRTLRIPDDGRDYPLPPGLGRFPMTHIDDHRQRVPASWMERGGVLLPMYQSEAMWVNFMPHHPEGRGSAYPFAVKVAAGKINAVSGESWNNDLKKQPEGWFDGPVDYMVIPEQPWLDGYYVDKGRIRQFVAMPLGAGYSAEEQITGKGEFGGAQIIVYPMRGDVFERRFPKQHRRMRSANDTDEMSMLADCCCAQAAPEGAMGLGAGGAMTQEIYEDPYDFTDWAHDRSSRCFVHLVNSLMWRQYTTTEPPQTPPTAREYERSCLPWFDYYNETATTSSGSPILNKVKSVFNLGQEKGEQPLPENEPVDPKNVVGLKKNPNEVRDGDF